jgi:hypothetical protein
LGVPPHEVYIEPFLGGGAIMRQKRPALLNIGLDLDAAVIARFNDEAPTSLFPAMRVALAVSARRRRGLSPVSSLHWQ